MTQTSSVKLSINLTCAKEDVKADESACSFSSRQRTQTLCDRVQKQAMKVNYIVLALLFSLARIVQSTAISALKLVDITSGVDIGPLVDGDTVSFRCFSCCCFPVLFSNG